MLKIMKASAGSGKTYNLAKTYISLLISSDDRYTYRHILAVTFTNKATDEMKSRILKELYVLASTPEESAYLSALVSENDMSKEEVCSKAQTVLYDILHDYSAFAVSTIDKFFQQALKAFSREIGQFASYQVEIDRKSLIAESVDRVLDSLTEDNADLLPWLTKNVIEQIESGERYDLESDLLNRALRLKSSQRQEIMEKVKSDIVVSCSKERLTQVRVACREIIRSFNERVQQYAHEALQILLTNGIRPEESQYKFMKILYDYDVLDKYTHAEAPSDSFMKRARDPELWFAQSKRKQYLAQLCPALSVPLEQLCDIWEKDAKVYNTSFVIDDQVYGLGVAVELEKAFNDIMREKNVLSLDDSNTLLRDIIDKSDAPFVYEKLGVRYEYFLLDEFQDTSSIQWENFRPLILNSDSQGGHNLIVGDVKQSIYRWRGSDWKLLNDTIPAEFDRHVQVNLQTNYRSLSTIVGFNNVFFKVAARILDKISGYEKAVGPIGRIYADVRQNVAADKEDTGCVTLTFCPDEDQLNQVHNAVIRAIEAGARLSDIAVLVRSNSSGEAVAAHLIENGIPVITEEALKVKSALTVRRLVSLMSYIDNPENTVNGYLASSLDVEIPESSISLIDMAESLIRSLKKSDPVGMWRGEALHLQTFMDCLLDFVSSNGNNLRAFLKYWSEKDPSISSSPSGESVRVMTIHKSKGLDFQYVILPFVEDIKLYRPDNRWCVPELKGTALDGKAEGIYDVHLSGFCENTLFSEHYERERFLQQVDNLNILYVAMTRARLGMHLIAKCPPASQKSAFSKMVLTNFKDFSQILYWFAERTGVSKSVEEEVVTFVKGQMPSFDKHRKDKDTGSRPLVVTEGDEYPSIPLNFDISDKDAEVCERGRLKFSSDALDFFREDTENVSNSRRVRGVVLHDILSRVVMPEDLDASIDTAYLQGEITYEEKSDIRELLLNAIQAGMPRGWFPSERSCVMNEITLMDVGGKEYRPDRVVVENGKVVIIDYKFGVRSDKYIQQVERYVGLWKRMGYHDIKAFLWYIDTGEVVEVL